MFPRFHWFLKQRSTAKAELPQGVPAKAMLGKLCGGGVTTRPKNYGTNSVPHQPQSFPGMKLQLMKDVAWSKLSKAIGMGLSEAQCVW